MHAMDKHEKKIIVAKTFKVKGPRKRFGYFWFLCHSLRWFLVASPKDTFTLVVKIYVATV